jgi:hypothetical protein
MDQLSQHDDEEPAGRSGPPVWLVALVVIAVAILVVLHVTGVVGPGA